MFYPVVRGFHAFSGESAHNNAMTFFVSAKHIRGVLELVERGSFRGGMRDARGSRSGGAGRLESRERPGSLPAPAFPVPGCFRVFCAARVYY